MRGLYAIVDMGALAARALAPVAFAEAVLAARPGAIQLRDKQGGPRETLALLREILPLARRAGVPLYANDRPDLALLANCDGVHVGQTDLLVADVRAVANLAQGARGARDAKPFRVGLSTHTDADFDAGCAALADYLAVGPIFTTANKESPASVLGPDALGERTARARAHAPGLPIVAIGGITLARAEMLRGRCDAVAVIGALLPDDVPSSERAMQEAVCARARAFARAFLGEQKESE